MSERKHWHFSVILIPAWYMHLPAPSSGTTLPLQLPAPCKLVHTWSLDWENANGTSKGTLFVQLCPTKTVEDCVGSGRKTPLFFKPATSWGESMLMCVCEWERQCREQRFSIANALVCWVCSPEIIQPTHQDWTVRRGGGWRGLKALPQFRASTRPSSILSLDVQDVALFQAKAGLVLVKKALERLDVHCMIHIDDIVCWILNFWHSDWFPNCKEKQRIKSKSQSDVSGWNC